jgi:hypothetical protein
VRAGVVTTPTVFAASGGVPVAGRAAVDLVASLA